MKDEQFCASNGVKLTNRSAILPSSDQSQEYTSQQSQQHMRMGENV